MSSFPSDSAYATPPERSTPVRINPDVEVRLTAQEYRDMRAEVRETKTALTKMPDRRQLEEWAHRLREISDRTYLDTAARRDLQDIELEIHAFLY